MILVFARVSCSPYRSPNGPSGVVGMKAMEGVVKDPAGADNVCAMSQ